MEKNKKKRKYLFWKNIFAEYKYTWAVLGGLLILGIVLGLLIPNSAKILLLEAIFDKFTTLLQGAETDWEVSLAIVGNNIQVSLILFFLGVTLIAPVFIVLSNGLIIGVFFAFIARLEALQPGIFISSIVGVLPHGIIEIPAFIITAALGVNLVIKIFFPTKFIPKKTRSHVLKDTILRYAFIILPLFIAAALIEAYISPFITSHIDKYINAKYQKQYLAEYSVDKVMLAKNNCVPMSEENITPESMLSATLMEQIKIIFDDAKYGELKKYRNINKYIETYSCDDAGLKINIWEIDKDSFANCVSLQKDILSDLGYELEKIDDNLYKVKNYESFYYYGFIQKTDNIYMLVNYFGENEDLIRKVLTK